MDYKKVIQKAHDEKYAIPHFNFDSLEMAKFILEVCEELRSPLFLAVSESAINYMGGLNVVKNLVESLRKDLKISVPVILHLDHGKNVDICVKAIESGFDSVMLDASKRPIEENIKEVQKLNEYSDKFIIECEVGAIGENGNQNIAYAKIDECTNIIKNTNAFMLAPAIGTVHGLYKGEQKININVLKEINKNLNIPLVLHGGSDTLPETIVECINNGISKININTDLKKAWVMGVKEYIKEKPDELDYRKYIKNAEKYIKEELRNKIKLFNSENKA